MAKAIKAAVIVAAVATGVGMLVAPGLIAGAGAIAGFAAQTAGAYFATTFVTTLVLGAVSKAMAKTPTGASITQQDKNRNIAPTNSATQRYLRQNPHRWHDSLHGINQCKQILTRCCCHSRS